MIGQYKKELRIHQDTLRLELLYPRNNEVKKMQVGLCDVRATDDILIEYDFERDG